MPQPINKIDEKMVLDALRNVEDPDLKKDIVTLNMVKNMKIEGRTVAFDFELTTPACPIKDVLKNACINAIHAFVNKELEVKVNLTSRVTHGPKGLTHQTIKNIILVSSAKGGVGKSTIAANMAVGLSKFGAKVGLIDADIYGPSQPILFDVIKEKPKVFTDEKGRKHIQPIKKYGIELLSIGFFIEPGQPVPWRGPMLSTAIKQLFSEGDWNDIDYLIVDMPPGTGDVYITVAQEYPITGAVIVTTPQKVALSDTAKGMAMFMMKGIEVPILGLIENMSYFTPKELPNKKYYIFGKDGAHKLAGQIDVPVLGKIPIVESITEYSDVGQSIVLNDEQTGQYFAEIAQKIAQRVSILNA